MFAYKFIDRSGEHKFIMNPLLGLSISGHCNYPEVSKFMDLKELMVLYKNLKHERFRGNFLPENYPISLDDVFGGFEAVDEVGNPYGLIRLEQKESDRLTRLMQGVPSAFENFLYKSKILGLDDRYDLKKYLKFFKETPFWFKLINGCFEMRYPIQLDKDKETP